MLHYLQRGADTARTSPPASPVDGGQGDGAGPGGSGVEKEVMMTGGVAKNVAVRSELERMLNVRMRRTEASTRS